MKNKYTGCFLKFGAFKYMNKLLYKGDIHCKPMHYFTQLADENGRGDVYESSVEIRNFNGKVLFNQKNTNLIPLHDGHFTMIKSYNSSHACGNLYCLYFHDISNQEMNNKESIFLRETIDEYCVLIYNSQEFAIRIRKRLNELGLIHQSHFVSYVDFKRLNGKRNQFTKDVAFMNQHEYRFWIKYPLVEDLNFSIGNIQDIAIIDTTENIMKNWAFMKIDENFPSSIKSNNTDPNDKEWKAFRQLNRKITIM